MRGLTFFIILALFVLGSCKSHHKHSHNHHRSSSSHLLKEQKSGAPVIDKKETPEYNPNDPSSSSNVSPTVPEAVQAPNGIKPEPKQASLVQINLQGPTKNMEKELAKDLALAEKDLEGRKQGNRNKKKTL